MVQCTHYTGSFWGRRGRERYEFSSVRSNCRRKINEIQILSSNEALKTKTIDSTDTSEEIQPKVQEFGRELEICIDNAE